MSEVVLLVLVSQNPPFRAILNVVVVKSERLLLSCPEVVEEAKIALDY